MNYALKNTFLSIGKNRKHARLRVPLCSSSLQSSTIADAAIAGGCSETGRAAHRRLCWLPAGIPGFL